MVYPSTEDGPTRSELRAHVRRDSFCKDLPDPASGQTRCLRDTLLPEDRDGRHFSQSQPLEFRAADEPGRCFCRDERSELVEDHGDTAGILVERGDEAAAVVRLVLQ
jgi:hypothetical protein